MQSFPLEVVYQAEWRAIGGTTRSFPTISSIQEYVNNLWLSDWFEEEFPYATMESPPIVEARSSSARYSLAIPEKGVIAMANDPAARVAGTILHEVAHMVTPNHDHDVIWRSAFLKLVRRELGFYAWVALEAEFSRMKEGME